MTLEQRARDVVEKLKNRVNDAPMPSEHLMDESAETIEALLARIAELEADRALSQKA